ncbi:MAG TPA: hypothetical protein VGS80_05125, partial [Ktedonobacterales bacterium]|nr:hypothetical protein [Ktedonobacterales bacterium]
MPQAMPHLVRDAGKQRRGVMRVSYHVTVQCCRVAATVGYAAAVAAGIVQRPPLGHDTPDELAPK